MNRPSLSAKRASLTTKEREAMAVAQNYICACGCGQTLGRRRVAEHWQPVALGNSNKPDAIFRADCAATKTKRDMGIIAKVKRIFFGNTQFDKRKRAGGTRLAKREFDKNLSKKFDGSVERRDG